MFGFLELELDPNPNNKRIIICSVEVAVDLNCPWCYTGHELLSAAAADAGVQLCISLLPRTELVAGAAPGVWPACLTQQPGRWLAG